MKKDDLPLKDDLSLFAIPEFSLGRKFSLLGKLYFTVLSDKLKHLGIDKHFSILVLIERTGDHCSQKFIADTLHIDKATLVGKLDNLEMQGFIKRIHNPADRREYWIQLTDKAAASIPEIQTVINQVNEMMMTGLTPGEATVFNNLLHRLYDNIQNVPKA